MAAKLFLFFGSDEYRVARAVREAVDRLVPHDAQVLSLETVDGRVDNVAGAVEAVARCLDAVRTVGFFGAEKVVWLRDANFFADTGVGRFDSVKESVNELVETIQAGLPEGQALVISADRVDKRFAFYKTCGKVGEVHEFAAAEKGKDADKQAAGFAAEIVKQRGLRMNGDVLQAFVARVGFDSRTIVNEVEKLSLFIGERKQIDMADVAAVSAGSRDILVWDLTDALGARELPKALTALRQLIFQKENAIGLLFMLQSKIRELILLREALECKWLTTRGGKGGSSYAWAGVPPEASALYDTMEKKDPRKMTPYRMGIVVEQARKFSLRELLRCRKLALEAHEALVSSPVPETVTLELMLVRMMG